MVIFVKNIHNYIKYLTFLSDFIHPYFLNLLQSNCFKNQR